MKTIFTILTVTLLGLAGFTVEPVKPAVSVDEANVILFTAPAWCGPCRKFERTVWSDPEVQEELKKHKIYVLDLSDNSRAKWAIAKKFGVRSVPQVYIYGKTYIYPNKEKLLDLLKKHR